MSTKRGFCPSCGAPVEFRFAAAIQTVCPFCRSILIRTDVNWEKVGEAAELADHSLIQLGSEGKYDSRAFTVVGRIAYEWEQGGWNEWHIAFGDGRSGWLSDAQAEYAVTFHAAGGPAVPEAKEVYPGKRIAIGTLPLEVATVTRARYAGVEGDLPFEYWDKQEIVFADLRSGSNHFATIDYSEQPPMLFTGEFVEFASLRMTNLREAGSDLKQQPRALNCPNCGSSVELRAQGETLTAVCPQCLSLMDASSPIPKLLQKINTQRRVTPAIPLGSTGALDGVTYEVIGFQCRHITVEGAKYEWREFLLFNRDQGFRYLTEYDGHWNFCEPLKGIPESGNTVGRPSRNWKGTHFRHFQRAMAETNYVLGEFPWRVKVGERAEVNDFVAPPLSLSAEKSENETTWTLGRYITGAEIWKAFQLKERPPRAYGVYSNQPSPYKDSVWSIWTVALFFIFLLGASSVLAHVWMTKQEVFRQAYTYTPGTPGDASFVTSMFELKGRPSNVELDIETDALNNWVYFNLALINEQTGHGYDWGREVSYYSGVDSDGGWSEGSTNDSSRIGHVPAGRYYLRVEPESTPEPGQAGKPIRYTIRVRRDIPVNWPYVVAFFLLVLPPIVQTFRSLMFESKRWQESDYAPSGDD
ncbi:MAG: DUF4178 domain-containing protein [Bryobacteraceae bacterium]